MEDWISVFVNQWWKNISFKFEHLNYELYGKITFSKLDLKWAYLQYPVEARDISKTAEITLVRLFEYFVHPL